ncbi:MAG: hypothetical protein OXJ52_05770 [Oligoflexia bacterium]|nr:hypothetical protein [Oligoflexia bacterium]
MSRKILFSFLLFICSCRGSAPYIVFDDLPEETAEKSLSDEETQGIEKIQCRREGKACSEYKSCQSFCEDLFFTQKGKENCYKWPHSFFKDFKKFVWQLETSSFSNLDFPTMKCFFKMSEDHRIRLFKNFSEKPAEKLLAQIAVNYKLALPLFHSDKKNFDILKDLFEKIDRRAQRAMMAEIFSRNHFLILAHKHKNKPAWDWIDSFIRYDCKKTSSCRHPLEYYCEILEETYRGDLESFFENRWFERAYKEDIELSACDSYDCEYGKVSDFKEFCEKI